MTKLKIQLFYLAAAILSIACDSRDGNQRIVGQLESDRIPQEVAHTATALWSGIHGICILALTGKLYLGGAFSMVKLIDTLIDSVIAEFLGERVAAGTSPNSTN
jgi:hypothetical protein